MCLFDENLGDIDKIVDNAKLFDNYQPTETIMISSYLSICYDLYNVMKTNNEITLFVVYMLLKIKGEINSKNNRNLNLDRMITRFSNFKNIVTPLEKESRLVLIELSKISSKQSLKKKQSNHELSKIIQQRIVNY